MEEKSGYILYKDEYYVVLQDDNRRNITLIMPARRVALEFTYDEWQNLRDIVAGIEIPDDTEDKQVSLHEDDIHLFEATGEVIEWRIGDRMVAVAWDYAGWERFKAMAAAVGHVPWTVI